jgi:hypothetical protein
MKPPRPLTKTAVIDLVYRTVLTLSQDKELAEAVKEALVLNWK